MTNEWVSAIIVFVGILAIIIPLSLVLWPKDQAARRSEFEYRLHLRDKKDLREVFNQMEHERMLDEMMELKKKKSAPVAKDRF